jgi:hypothetical protein
MAEWFSVDPPDDDDAHDPDLCTCGADLITYNEEPGGQQERCCPVCDAAMLAHCIGEGA